MIGWMDAPACLKQNETGACGNGRGNQVGISNSGGQALSY
jgi:hypothetical protein